MAKHHRCEKRKSGAPFLLTGERKDDRLTALVEANLPSPQLLPSTAKAGAGAVSKVVHASLLPQLPSLSSEQ